MYHPMLTDPCTFYRTQVVFVLSDLWVRFSLTELARFADLTDVTLADEDTNSILADNANRAFQGNVAMRVMQPGDNAMHYRLSNEN